MPPPDPPPKGTTKPAQAKAADGGLDLFGGSFDEDHFGVGGPAPATASVPAGKPSGDSSSLYGDNFDFGEGSAEAGGAKLELDSYHPPGGSPPLPAPAKPAMPSSFERGPTVSAAPIAPIQDGAAALLAGYGPAPRGIHLAPLYTWRVFSRQRILLGTLRGLNLQIESNEQTRNRMLADLATQLRPALEKDARFQSNFTAIRQIEGIFSERGAMLEQTSAAHQAQAAELDAQLQAAQAQIDERGAGERAASDDVARKRQAHDRVLAKQKRLLIEARGLAQIAEEAAKIAALQDEAGALQPELDEKRGELEAANLELQRIQNEIGGINAHARDIQGQRRALDTQFGKQIGERSAGFKDAEQRMIQGLAALGKAALSSDAASGVDPAQIESITKVETESRRLGESRDHHLQALDAYDRNAYRLGMMMIGALAILLVVGIVVLALAL